MSSYAEYIDRRKQVMVTSTKVCSLIGPASSWRSARIDETNDAFVYGEENEYKAREWFERTWNAKCKNIGRFYQYEQNARIGAKIDATVDIGSERVLEIKTCTKTLPAHPRAKDALQLWVNCLCTGIDRGILLYYLDEENTACYETSFPRGWWSRNIDRPLEEAMSKGHRINVLGMVTQKMNDCFGPLCIETTSKYFSLENKKETDISKESVIRYLKKRKSQ